MDELERGVSYNHPIYIPSQNQTDIIDGYNGKLQYEMVKAEVGLRRNQIANEQRLQLQYGLEDIKLRFKTYMAMLGATVYMDCSRNLIFALSDSNGNKISSKRLLNVKGFESKILVSEMLGGKSALCISWENEKKSQIFFSEFTNGILPSTFLKKLKSHGVLFNVSGRTEKKAAEALLAYSVQTAKTIEVSACSGWCKWSDGTWHFAWEDEITMKEILEYEK